MAVSHPFAIVPLGMLGTVSASAVCVYAVLAEAANQHQTSWPSKATIGDRTGLSARTVQRCIAELRDEGWIRVSERSRDNGSQTSNTYLVMRVRGDIGVLPPQDTGVSPPETAVSPPEPDPVEPNPLSSEPLFSIVHPPADEQPNEQQLFDMWWAEYPRKVRKPEARRAYARAAKKVGYDRLLDAMRTYRDFDSRVEAGFILHASTWLNQECWDDEIVESRQNDEERQWQLLREQMGADTDDGP